MAQTYNGPMCKIGGHNYGNINDYTRSLMEPQNTILSKAVIVCTNRAHREAYELDEHFRMTLPDVWYCSIRGRKAFVWYLCRSCGNATNPATAGAVNGYFGLKIEVDMSIFAKLAASVVK